MFMCRAHWFKLRKPMQKAIWREYRPGQERDKNPSQRYLAVQRLAVAEVAFRPNDAKSLEVMKPYLVASMQARVQAIREGAGDPLQGLLPNLPEVPR